MASLVRYNRARANLVPKLVPILANHPYARYARAAQKIYSTGRAAAPYARAAINLYKRRRYARMAPMRQTAALARRRRRTMYRVGERVGSSSAKWDELTVGLTNMNPQTLNQVQLLNIVKFSSESYNRRQTDQVNFRGIKFCINFRVESALGTAKAWICMAVISPKANLASGDPIPSSDFFRSSNGSTRDVDFGSAGLNNLDYKCLPINTDQYNVHMRKYCQVGPAQSTEGLRERLLEWYLPVKRQIRYNDNSALPEGKNMYFVWWFSASDSGTPANSVRFQYTIKRYFRDTKH